MGMSKTSHRKANKRHTAFRLCPTILKRLRVVSEETSIPMTKVVEAALKEKLTQLEAKYL